MTGLAHTLAARGPAGISADETHTVLLVGDTHGNSAWWRNVVVPAALAHGADQIVVLGDFGYWPATGKNFVDLVSRSPVEVAFLDGNHENHPLLRAHAQAAASQAGTPDGAPIRLKGSLSYLPRGARTNWAGTSVAVLGGARSPDRQLRTPGYSWFPEEAVTAHELEAVISRGHADILLTHDAPLCAPVPVRTGDDIPFAWRSEMPNLHAHRKLIEEALDGVKPHMLIHGHFHVHWKATLERDWGICMITGLAHDSAPTGNMAVLTCRGTETLLRTLTTNETVDARNTRR